MKKTVLIIAILLLVGLIAGCSQPAQVPAQKENVKIGAVVSLTGVGSNVGKHMWQSAVLATEEINANGGIFVKEYNKKLPVVLVQGDDETNGEAGVKIVTKLITQDNVDILVGGYSSGVTMATRGVVAEHKVPYIITGASSPDITRKQDVDTSYLFHYCPTTAMYGEYTMIFTDQVIRPAINDRFSFSADRPLRLALLYQDTAYGQGVVNGANDTIVNNKMKIEIVSKQSFKMGDADFRTQLTVIKAANPDVIYAAAFPAEQSQIVLQARRDVGLDTLILAVETNDNPDYYKGIGQFGEYSIIESRFSPYITPHSTVAAADAKFKADYVAKWGSFPDMMGTSTYEGVYVAAKAIENAGTLDKQKVRETLANMEMPEIVEAMDGGMIRFSKDFREVRFGLFMEQLKYDSTVGECRPTIVWPDNLKDSTFVLPDWYKPGST
ncbi:MAG: ABC transporter substrate-binding protein [Methanomicrobiales archaeon]|nr:ABC transporter substrate-binding protein [Methanomicrobiales archaeon]